jgi:hypothetical protein
MIVTFFIDYINPFARPEKEPAIVYRIFTAPNLQASKQAPHFMQVDKVIL